MRGLTALPARALRRRLLGTTALLLALPALAPAQTIAPGTMPVGGRVAAGSATIRQDGAATRIDQASTRAVIDWTRFDIGRDHAVQFQQPSAQSWTLNRVAAPDPSVIAGRISANGGVAIVNGSGVVFAEGAQVSVGSLIAAAPGITNEAFMAGRMVFDGAPRPGARVENRGTLTIAEGGLAALVGPEARNGGTIQARLGRVVLGGAEAFALDLAGDGLLAFEVTQAVRQTPGGGAALVTESGTIQADGGSVLLSAAAVSGLVETLVAQTGSVAVAGGSIALRATGGDIRVDGALSARNAAGGRGGMIEVAPSGAAILGARAVVDVSGAAGGGKATIGAALASAPGAPVGLAQRSHVARGAELRADALDTGTGGTVIVHGAARTDMSGRISARGGRAGGDGGAIEVSAQGGLAFDGIADAGAAAGAPGRVLIDPETLRVVAALTGGGGEITAASIAGSTGTIVLEATREIAVEAAIVKPSGDLALQTTATDARGISFAAPVTLAGGVLDVWTAGRVAVAPGVTLRAGAGATDRNAVRLAAGLGIDQAGAIIGTGGGNRTTGTGEILAVSLWSPSGDIVVGGSIEGRANGAGIGGAVGLEGRDVTLSTAAASATGSGVLVVASRDLALAGTLRGTGNAAFGSGRSGAVLAVASAARIEGGTIDGAGGDVGVMAGGGALALDRASLSSAGTLRLESYGATGIARSTLAAETLIVRAGPVGDGVATILLDGATLQLGASGLLSAGGGIGAGARSSLVARDGSRRPAIAFDTRRSSAVVSAATGLAPDLPGRTVDQQTSQIRVPGTDLPGSFGAAGASAAGPVALSLAAGQSPVFLLLDGGSASGTLGAGRLGVLGLGGTVALSGSLGSRTDRSAAQLGDVAGPTGATARESYRFNSCALASSACTPEAPVLETAPPIALLPPPVAAPVTVTQTSSEATSSRALAVMFLPQPELHRARPARNRLGDPDIVVPNAVEQDY
jgi:filamentous hemagglutinin family protein